MTDTAYPTSFAQQRLWFLDQLEPGTAAYNAARAFRIIGPLDLEALIRAVQEVVRRHESLRTIFDSVDGQARQIVLPEIEMEIPLVDLSGTPVEGHEQAALAIGPELLVHHHEDFVEAVAIGELLDAAPAHERGPFA